MKTIKYTKNIIYGLKPFSKIINDDLPPVIVNSFPKSGTHLLGRIIKQLNYHEIPIMVLNDNYLDFNKNGDWNKWEPIVNAGLSEKIINPKRIGCPSTVAVSKLRMGQYFVSHLKHSTKMNKLIEKKSIKHIFIIRDLRDVICSMANYRMNLKAHAYLPNWYFYLKSLQTEDERLLTCIKGLDRFLESYLTHLEYGWGWLTENNVLIVRFENLVGHKGGGDDDIQRKEIAKIANYLNIDLDDTKINYLCENVWGGNTRTIDKGVIGAWIDSFSPKVELEFNGKFSTHMKILGYY